MSEQKVDLMLLINVFSRQYFCNDVRTLGDRAIYQTVSFSAFLLGVARSPLTAVIGFGMENWEARLKLKL